MTVKVHSDWFYASRTQECQWTCPRCEGNATLFSPRGEPVEESLFVHARETHDGLDSRAYLHNARWLFHYLCASCNPVKLTADEITDRRKVVAVSKALGAGG